MSVELLGPLASLLQVIIQTTGLTKAAVHSSWDPTEAYLHGEVFVW